MNAIFDKDLRCVGWLDNRTGMVFSDELRWIGFIQRNYFFAWNTRWIGGFVDGSFVDRAGRPVAWVEGKQPQSTLPSQRPITPLQPITPLRPLQPLTPIKPLRPLTPIGGWSVYSWSKYIEQY